MRKAILTIFVLIAILWCMSEPVDGKLDWGWFIGELIGFAVIFFCGRGLRKYYPKD